MLVGLVWQLDDDTLPGSLPIWTGLLRVLPSDAPLRERDTSTRAHVSTRSVAVLVKRAENRAFGESSPRP